MINSLVAELQKNPKLSYYDFSTLEIIALSMKSETRIMGENQDKPIRSLQKGSLRTSMERSFLNRSAVQFSTGIYIHRMGSKLHG